MPLFICLRLAAVFLAMSAVVNVYASSPEYIESDNIDSRVNVESPLGYSFRSPVVLKKYRQTLDHSASFWRDSALTANIRSYSFWRDNSQLNDFKASALGGELRYTSGWHQGWLQVESSVFSSQKVYGPERFAGSGLLQPNQRGYTTLAKLNAKLRYRKSTLSLYRSELNTPFANQKDVRMTPLMFENYSLLSADIDNVDIVASVVKKYKPTNAETFKPMLAHIDADNNNPLYFLGARYHLKNKFSGGLIGYHLEDYIDIGYAEYLWSNHWQDYRIDFSQQYIRQRSSGREVAGHFSNHAFGVKLDIEYQAWLWTIAWHYVSGDGMRTDWGSYPGYNSMMLRDFNRADERSWRLGFRYDMQRLVKGLSLVANYIEGDTPDRGKHRSADEKEYDLTINYAVQNRFLKDLNIRLRYAKVEQQFKQGAGNIDDLRLIINYQLPLF